MKNLLFGIVTILFMMFGCSDIPTEPTIPYQSGEVKSSDRDDKSRDLSVVRMKGESESEADLKEIAEFEATSGSKALFKKGLKFTAKTYFTNSKLSFKVPLESNIESSERYYYEIHFFKKVVDGSRFPAMKTLKKYLSKDFSDDSKASIKKLCVVSGSSLIQKTDNSGTGEVDCELTTDIGSWGGLEDPQKDTDEVAEQMVRIRNLEFKSVLILLHQDGDVNHSNPSGLSAARSNSKSFGYRCLLKKGASDPDGTGDIVYESCRYPKSKGGSS